MEAECLRAVRGQAECREIYRVTIRIGVRGYNWEPAEFHPLPTRGAEETARDVIALLQRKYALLEE
jgi:hypothetical protein